MKLKKPVLLFVFLTLIMTVQAQKHTISGYVEDVGSGEKIFMANVYNSTKMLGTASNTYGFYSLSLPEGDVQLICSYVGYKAFGLNFHLHKDTVINIRLNQSMQLQEVVVKGGVGNNALRSSQMSINELSLKTVKSLPAFLGEVDPIKT
jgi:hypothetical protein